MHWQRLMSPYALFLEFSAKKSDSQSVANTCAPVCVVSGIERGAPRLANCGKHTGKRISQKLLRNIVKFLTIIYDVLRIVPMTYLKQTTDEVEMRGPESKYDTRKLNSYPSKVIPCTSTRTARFSGLGAGAFVGGFQHNLIVFWCNFQHFYLHPRHIHWRKLAGGLYTLLLCLCTLSTKTTCPSLASWGRAAAA